MILKIFCISIFFLLNYSYSQNYSLRFFGNGNNDIDRIKIKIDSPHKPADVTGSFTIEFWIKANHLNNNGTVYAQSNGDGWITGNVIIDRDIYGQGDWGDFGIAIGKYTGGPVNHRVASFGIDRLGTGVTIRGTTNVADTNWHHIAVTRDSATGVIRLFVNGNLESSATGPIGNISYRDGRPTSWNNSDPFLVIGAEKHDAGTSYPSFNGYIDELRISKIVRYNVNFTPPTSPFVTDIHTAALYHFDEASGDTIYDVSNIIGGPSNGIRKFGGSPAGPIWTAQNPFSITSVKNYYDILNFNLQQNYPNPFNPITAIKFNLLHKTFVRLIIYDLLGKELETLISEELSSGNYEIVWQGSNYPSGIYFCRLITENFSQTIKMVLTK